MTDQLQDYVNKMLERAPGKWLFTYDLRMGLRIFPDGTFDMWRWQSLIGSPHHLLSIDAEPEPVSDEEFRNFFELVSKIRGAE